MQNVENIMSRKKYSRNSVKQAVQWRKSAEPLGRGAAKRGEDLDKYFRMKLN